jgi:hypothetical protein
VKVCSKCKTEHSSKSSWCNECRKIQMREYRKTDAGKAAAKLSESLRIVTPERSLMIKTLTKKWAKTSKGKALLSSASKTYRAKNRAKINAYERNRRDSDPLFKLACNTRRRIREIFKLQGYTKRSKTGLILGCDFVVFKLHIEQQFTFGMTWDNFGEWELDHIIPLSRATTEAELLQLNHYTNIAPMWGLYNKIKQDMLPSEWEAYIYENGIDVSAKPIKQAVRGATCL